MSQSQEPQKNGKNQIPEFDLETIKAIVAQKGHELQIEAQKLRLEEKRLEQDGKLAEKSLEHNSKLFKIFPQSNVKLFSQLAESPVSFLLFSFSLFFIA